VVNLFFGAFSTLSLNPQLKTFFMGKGFDDNPDILLFVLYCKLMQSRSVTPNSFKQ